MIWRFWPSGATHQRRIFRFVYFCFAFAFGAQRLVCLAMEVIRYEREELPYQDLSSRFQLVSRDFNRQYAHIYSVRLMKFRSLLEDRVQKKWGNLQLYFCFCRQK